MTRINFLTVRLTDATPQDYVHVIVSALAFNSVCAVITLLIVRAAM